MIRVVEGQVLTVYEQFIDEFDDPLSLSNQLQGPKVRLLDEDKTVIVEIVASPDLSRDAGTWISNLPVPKLDLTAPVERIVTWLFIDDAGITHRSRTTVIIEPEVEKRKSDIVVLETDQRFEVSLPIRYNSLTDTLEFNLYRNNVAVYTQPLFASSPSVTIKPGVDTTGFVLPANGVAPAKLEPLLFMATYTRPGAEPLIFDIKLWSVTPQILVAASMVEDHINKARLENVIPALDYTRADLIGYLQRGLALFNSIAHLSGFTGTNMQGPILEGHVICSCYYALAAQLQAEGALAFDFSGQTTSLNIDRSPSIEAALGRIEGLIESQIKPLKKLLSQSGVLQGSGAEGGNYISMARSIGVLHLSNSPTTKLGLYTGNLNGRYRGR